MKTIAEIKMIVEESKMITEPLIDMVEDITAISSISSIGRRAVVSKEKSYSNHIYDLNGGKSFTINHIELSTIVAYRLLKFDKLYTKALKYEDADLSNELVRILKRLMASLTPDAKNFYLKIAPL